MHPAFWELFRIKARAQCAHVKVVVLLMLNKEFHGFAAGIHVPCIDGGLFGGTIPFSQNLITEIP